MALKVDLKVIQLAVSCEVIVVLRVDEGYRFPEMLDHHRYPPHQLLVVMFCG